MDEEKYVDMLNIFIQYFNKANGTDYHLFYDIERADETNDMIVEFREHIQEYSDSGDFEKRLYNPVEADISNFEAVYVLIVDGSIKCFCMTLLPIIIFMLEHVDYEKCNWDITLVKNDV
jgi:hypothetical protein